MCLITEPESTGKTQFKYIFKTDPFFFLHYDFLFFSFFSTNNINVVSLFSIFVFILILNMRQSNGIGVGGWSTSASGMDYLRTFKFKNCRISRKKPKFLSELRKDTKNHLPWWDLPQSPFPCSASDSYFSF